MAEIGRPARVSPGSIFGRRRPYRCFRNLPRNIFPCDSQLGPAGRPQYKTHRLDVR